MSTSGSVRNIEFVYHLDHIEYVKDGDPRKPLTMKEREICDRIVESIKRRTMPKIEFKQAIQITHGNASKIMSLPCVFTCRKSFNGKLHYDVHVDGMIFKANETDWIVEIEDMLWKVYRNDEWEALR